MAWSGQVSPPGLYNAETLPVWSGAGGSLPGVAAAGGGGSVLGVSGVVGSVITHRKLRLNLCSTQGRVRMLRCLL